MINFKEMLAEIRNMNQQFMKDFVIEYEPEEPENFDKMQILKQSGAYTDGIIQFDGIPDNKTTIQLTFQGDSHKSYHNLKNYIIRSIKQRKEWSYQ